MPWLRLIGGALGGVPKWVWYLLAAALAYHFALSWHAGKVRDHDKAVIAARDAQWQARFDAMAKRAEALARHTESVTAKVSQLQRTLNDAEGTRIDAGTRDMLVRGPGKAAAPTCGGSGSNSRLPTATGQSGASAGAANAAGALLPDANGAADRAVVPWSWLVGRGRQCDLDRAENVAWRNGYQGWAGEWAKWKAELVKLAGNGGVKP